MSHIFSLRPHKSGSITQIEPGLFPLIQNACLHKHNKYPFLQVFLVYLGFSKPRQIPICKMIF
ncbi:hypothetical protein BGS_0096 [Beggiatoa sp. SS]|nr:hypothetical protein BGS_0096 [Beggiatoa sp. SS]